jgi:hypothetical protein
MKKTVLIIIAAVSLFSCRNDIITKSTPEEVFLAFWKTLDENYVYFEEKGLNWDSVYSVYYPKARAATTDEDLFNILEKIIQMFKDRHIWCNAYLPDNYPYSSEIIYYYNVNIMYSFYNFIYIDDYMNKLNSLPLYSYQHKTKNYAMISLYTFDTYYPDEYRNTNLEKFVECLNGLNYSDGLIINLISNGGGHIPYDILSLFFTDEHIVFYDVYKTSAGHNDFGEKIPVTVKGRGFVSETVPVIVLTSSATYSAANCFAYAMSNLPNCTLVGKETGGGGGTVHTILLPNSWILNYPFKKSFSSQGENMEYPLMPDIYVKKVDELNFDITDESYVAIRAIEVLDSINGF